MNDNERHARAVSLVRKQLTPEFAAIFRYAIEQAQSHEIFLQRAGIGMAIRNLLAKEGILWEEAATADVWLGILKESINCIFPVRSESCEGRNTVTDANG